MTNLPSQLPHCPLHSTLLSCLGSESSFQATVPPPCRCRTPHVSSDTHDTRPSVGTPFLPCWGPELLHHAAPAPGCPRLAPCQVTEPSHGCLPQLVSGSATTCQVARSGVASSSPAWMRPSSSAHQGGSWCPVWGSHL